MPQRGRGGSWGRFLCSLLALSVHNAALGNSFSGTWEFGTTTSPIHPLISLQGKVGFSWQISPLSAHLGFAIAANTIWDVSLRFSCRAIGALLEARADFGGSPAAFTLASVAMSSNYEGITFRTTLQLGAVSSQNRVDVSLRGRLAGSTWGLLTRYSLLPLALQTMTFDLRGSAIPCLKSIKLSFSKDGFDGLDIILSELLIPLCSGVRGEARLAFGTTATAAELSLSLLPVKVDSCLTVNLGLLTGPGAADIQGVTIRSLEIRCTIAEIQMRIVHTRAWDLLELSGKVPAYKGSSWVMRVYTGGSWSLFGVERVSSKVRWDISSALYVSVAMDYTLQSGVGFEVTAGGRW